MRPFQYLDLPALLDMLAYVTSRYTKMFSRNLVTNEYIACRELLILLQTEVKARQISSNQSYNNRGHSQDQRPL